MASNSYNKVHSGMQLAKILLRFMLFLSLGDCVNTAKRGQKLPKETMASSWVIQLPVEGEISDLTLRKKAELIAKDTGLSLHGQIGGLRGHFLLVHDTFYRRDRHNTSTLHSVLERINKELKSHPEIGWSKQETLQRRYKRSLRFKDQYFPSQWHLNNLRFTGHDINVTNVWEHNITGHGVVVAIVDDGLEWTNPDIFDNYSSEGSYDLNSNDADPMPRADDVGLNHHGTRCAGEIAAVANTYCALGVAYHAKVSGIRVLDGPMTDSLEAMAFNMYPQVNDIYSCSWGPDDNGKTVDGPHQLAQAALAHGVREGRQGLGSVYVVASGNGGHYKDNCNFDGYANSIFTVTIGAVDESGQMPYYAEQCAAMLAATYSSGQGHLRNIVTTDWRMGSGTGCTDRHTGTSAAAPLAAGMLALALQVRWCLTWRDVQHLIVYSAVKHNVDTLDYVKNGAGFFHSHKYGFGLMDSWRLVNLAKVWKAVPWMTSWSSPVLHVNKVIPLTSNQLLETYTVKQDDLVELSTLEHVTLTVNIDHNYRGSILVSLVSPAGTESKLATERQQDRSSDGFVDWTFSTVRCWGERPTGTWQMIVVNTGLDDNAQGFLRNWRLTLYGSSMTADQVAQRRRLAQQAFTGRYLTNNETTIAMCAQNLNSDKKTIFTDRLLTILSLISGFCLLLAIYYMLDVVCSDIGHQLTEQRQAAVQKERVCTSPDSPDFVHSSTSTLDTSFDISTQLKSQDASRLSHILELGQTCHDQGASRSLSAELHPVLTDVAAGTGPEDENGAKDQEHEFERRLQFAMQQSLLLQGRQLREIEDLQGHLGHDRKHEDTSGMMGKKGKLKDKAGRPLKGILKHNSRFSKLSS